MIVPYFRLGCALELNTQRLSAYLATVATTCAAGDLRTTIALTCECAQLHWEFDDESGEPQAVTYDTPATDPAPWYDADSPESGGFLGFMVEDVVMNSVTSRSVTTRISSAGGGVLGPIRNKERRLDFTVLMFACNEAAMEYGFRFLSDSLGTAGCDDECGRCYRCGLCDADYRDSCSETDGGAVSLNRGRWLLKSVGLVEGPTWGDLPLPSAACNIRRVKFSLVSEYPWKFKSRVTECSEVALAGYPDVGGSCEDWTDLLCGEAEVSCSVTESQIIGDSGLVIDITAGSIPLQHIEVAIRPDPNGYECNPETRPEDYVRATPTDLLYFPIIPSNSRLIYDTSTETISLTLASGTTVDGTPYISTVEGRPPAFPTIRCGAHCLSVAVSGCSVVGSPTVSIYSIHREI